MGRDAAGRPDRRRAGQRGAGDRGLPRPLALLAPLARAPADRRRAGLLQPASPPRRRRRRDPGRSDRAVRILLRGRRRLAGARCAAGARQARRPRKAAAAGRARALLSRRPEVGRGGALARPGRFAGLLRDALGPGARRRPGRLRSAAGRQRRRADLAQGDPGRLAGLGKPGRRDRRPAALGRARGRRDDPDRRSDAGGACGRGGRLLADRELRQAIGRRGREFAETTMGVGRTAEAVLGLARRAGLLSGR